jgi:glycosyltransferase involved in cell wall biosynthesis
VTADLEMALAECSLLEGLRWRARSFLLQRWQRRMCRECDHLLTDSHTVAKRLEEDYGCDPRKCSVLHLGVDLHLFQPLELTPAFDIIAIGSFLHPRKGFRYLLEVYRALAGEGYRIADIGRRSEEQGRMLRAIERVTTFGVLPERELVSLLQRSSVLISTSLYEGFGLTLLEALACGKPAFAFSVGAIPEVLGPHGGDLLVSPRDTAALIAKARAFLSLSLEERADWGQRYRAFVSEHFPLDRAAKALCALYEELHSRR